MWFRVTLIAEIILTMPAESPQTLFFALFFIILTVFTISTFYELFSGKVRDRNGRVVHTSDEEPFMFILAVIVKIVMVIFIWAIMTQMRH